MTALTYMNCGHIISIIVEKPHHDIFQFQRSFLLKEILLEIGFIEEMRTTWGNKEVPQSLNHDSSYR